MYTIDTDTLVIKGFKRDATELVFNFGEDISAYKFIFAVKEKISDSDTEAKVFKTIIPNEGDTSVTVAFESADTENIEMPEGKGFVKYYWTLIAYKADGSYQNTVIPLTGNPFPYFILREQEIIPEIEE